jgi:hypothetical protein
MRPSEILGIKDSIFALEVDYMLLKSPVNEKLDKMRKWRQEQVKL